MVFAPKVLVESCKVSGENLMAGDEMTATITLKNTSTSESVQNMVVTVASKEDAFILKSASDSVYVGTIPAGGIAEVQFDSIVIVDHVQVGDVTEASFQAMNLGRTMIYNVRAEIMGDGLNPDGREYTETAEFTVTIESPFTDQETQEPDQTGQWWIIMAVLAGVIIVVVVILLIQRNRGKREQKGTDADEMVEDLPAESETK